MPPVPEGRLNIGRRIYLPLQINANALANTAEKYEHPIGGFPTVGLINELYIDSTIAKVILH